MTPENSPTPPPFSPSGERKTVLQNEKSSLVTMQKINTLGSPEGKWVLAGGKTVGFPHAPKPP